MSKYTPPLRPMPAAGRALVSDEQYASQHEMYRALGAHAIAHAGHEARDASDYIGRTYGTDRWNTFRRPDSVRSRG